jgi:soluble lytic murein transglycosylase-like protein
MAVRLQSSWTDADCGIVVVPFTTVFLLTLASLPAGKGPVAKTDVVGPATPGRLKVRLMELAAIRRLVNALIRQGSTTTQGERAAAWADFALVSQAVIGDTQIGPFDLEELARALTTAGGPRARATAGVAQRDEAAYRLLALGYSARETADVVSGRISQQALDTSRHMLAVGQMREIVANYLDSQYKQVIALRNAAMLRVPPRRGALPTAFDALIEKYASLHGIEAALIKAIVQTESAFNALARSNKGAIGLMQLMPMTARELGVDPFVPEQNIEGGVRYFSQLLKMFGEVELALVAYNGGPGYAQRYARGQVALYGETRDYVRKVLARFNAAR